MFRCCMALTGYQFVTRATHHAGAVGPPGAAGTPGATGATGPTGEDAFLSNSNSLSGIRHARSSRAQQARIRV